MSNKGDDASRNDPLGSTSEFVSQDVPDGVDRRTFLMRSAVIGSAAVIVGNPVSASGVLGFLDPRAGAEAVTAPGDPYGEPHRVRPDDGLLVVFPSWLFHWVHPYTGRTPRIAVLFNATVEAPAVTPGRASAREPIETSQAP